jgi:hypothetical protein
MSRRRARQRAEHARSSPHSLLLCAVLVFYLFYPSPSALLGSICFYAILPNFSSTLRYSTRLRVEQRAWDAGARVPSTDPCVLAASRSGKRLLWLEDTSINLYNASYYIDFQKARGRATARRRQLLVAAENEGDTEALKKLALEECLQRRLIASEDGLEDLDEVRPLLAPSFPQPPTTLTPCLAPPWK